ncbi:hypothetical protein IAD21_05888 [Abditibacteriota bacterium]|nr:hypothetical protein IAD21_05888 [Abditibacteriota bacterium]
MQTKFLLIVHSLWEVEDPPNEQIIDVIAALPADTSGNDYVILEKKDEAPGALTESYLQARPTRHPRYEGVFLVEYRDGLVGRHFGGHLEAEHVTDLFLNYRYGNPRWNETVVWRDISYRFEDLHPFLSPEELASSFFSEGEWEQNLKEKAERDRQFWEDWYENEEES